ncbi:LysE/ArgO family amino acid transporter [uncultured Ilyobacter sp.]|uniref:LysE/ArgO family amino acid transporter n=1 Tax=uncultured Ilyobacter sp. TaxID=544433 RepID=UPI0029F4BD1D|nr:LysE/ArgO family amino acid transporter [uncultured Ilyobacter sp.]
MNIAVAGQGFGLGLSLIAAIGAQNSYVLKKGILKNNVFAVAVTCTLIDAVLISLGTLGLGSIIEKNKTFMLLATLFGVLFLSYYGLTSIMKAIRSKESFLIEEGREKDSLKKTILTLLALSLLNPHLYLDTVILIGSIGSKYPINQRLDFVIGTCLASFVWFFGLAYGARVLIPIFKKEVTWKILDIMIGITMLSISLSLIQFTIKNHF